VQILPRQADSGAAEMNISRRLASCQLALCAGTGGDYSAAPPAPAVLMATMYNRAKAA
jgi:hypothetical protein